MEENLQVLEIGTWYKTSFRITDNPEDILDYNSSRTVLLDGNNRIIGLNLAGLNTIQLFPVYLLTDLRYLNLTNIIIDDLTYLRELTSLTHLYIMGDDIDDIEPLRKLVNLEVLNLASNDVNDISALIEMTKLRFLDITSNSIRIFGVLGQLTELQELHLDYVNSENALFLSGLKALKKLSLNHSELTTCDAFRGLKKLDHLELNSNNLNNIEGLKSLSKLEYLDLGNNRYIEDVSALSSLTSLKFLDLTRNKISDTSFLRKLHWLERLDMPGNEITDIQDLNWSVRLKHIDLSNNYIVELPNLGELMQLEFFSAAMNAIIDISVISDNVELQYLTLSGNPIINFDTLEPLKKIRYLSLDDSGISDISFLRAFTNLRNLDLSDNIVSGLDTLSELDSLKHLRLGSCGISKLNFLEELFSLESLYLNDNYIENAEPLSRLPNLKELNLRKNELSGVVFPGGLKKIEILNLSHNSLEEFTVGNFPKLRNLDISENIIEEITLKRIHKNLIFINASHNRIEDLSFLKYAKNIRNVMLSGNRINNLKVFENFSFLYQVLINNNMVPKIEEFSFILNHENLIIKADGNPCFSKQQLVLSEKDNHYTAIANELMKLEDAQVKASLPEKVVLLGNHASGKSSLLYYLQNGKTGYKDDTTHILKIENYPKRFDKLPKAIIYDFGGQDFYHGIYKAFLTLDALTILLWRAATNYCHLEPDSKQRPNRNFDVKYWMGQKNYSKMDGEVLLVRTHYDKDIGYPQTSYLNDYPEIEQEFFVSLTDEDNNPFNSKLNKAALSHLREKLEEVLGRRRTGRDMGTSMSKPYYNFLLYILNAPDSHLPVSMEELRNHYKVRDQWRFIEDVYQLHLQGILLKHNDHVWLKPVALTRYVHDEILNKEHLGNGIIEKSIFETRNFTPRVIDLLVDQKVLFLHEYGLTSDMEPRQEYIIPNYLPLHDEMKSWFSLISFDQDNVLFTLKFRNFLPFGLINQLICYFGKLPDNKMFWRDLLIFTIESKVKVMIRLDFETLEIKVHAHFKAEASNDFKNNTEKYLFYCIMAMYWDFSMMPENIEEFSQMYRQIKQHDEAALPDSSNAYSYVLDFYKDEECRPFDLYISKDNINYINYRILCDMPQRQLKIQSFRVDADKNLENSHEVQAYTYQNFTHRNLKAMKKIFISYSRKDKRFKDELKTQLKLIERYSVAKAWSCEEMHAGEWDKQIQEELKESDIIIYMVSDNFLASDYIMDKEVNVGIELVKNNPDKRIICVLVRECSWDSWQFLADNFTQEGKSQANLGKYQFIPWHIFKPKTDNEREELISLEQWGRDGFEVRSLAYKQITSKVMETIKQMG